MGSRHSAVAALILGSAVLGACDETGTEPGESTPATITVDASTDWAFVALDGEAAEEIQVPDPRTSTTWHLALHATDVMLNGGDAGPGDVEGYCLCQNASATASAVMAMTAESELADFEAVTAADIPTESDAWLEDELVPAIAGWWTYDPVSHVVAANPDSVFKVRTHTGEAYAKVRVTEIVNATQAHAGEVTLEFAVQGAAGAAMGAVQTITVDASSGPAYVDLFAGAESDASSWDLMVDGYAIRVNGGVSGDGQAGALPVTDDWASITDASDLESFLYRGDAYGGVFAAEEAGRRWYLYNLEGNHLIYPTYNVYLIRTGAGDVYKVQLVSYYGPTGDRRQITFRYERLET